ncbi:ribosome maturation factor RimP [Phorcysia thermohydrogeniphila]|uniref:Ribosome maturation factor RimP n=1 Tax=Phorcysia thermohydrogeniphila TaxID=936138 RepID=A0A4R1GCX4_9BACT|nr:ribosome maturation factor RimP [Phorcysia thermohydrogeniphila]TCK04621.1 ribosome maturation factor RimP [Phorcysia thermohydrogeniphila]
MEERIQEIVNRVRELLLPILEEGGFELVDIEFVREPVGWVLRIYADRPEGGITISDCQWISERIGTLLDVEDLIPHSYNLEVSSPGLDRPLKTRRDFERHKGVVVKIKTHEPMDNQRNFKGEVVATSERGVTVHDVSRNAEVEIPYENIKSARVDIDSLFNK